MCSSESPSSTLIQMLKTGAYVLSVHAVYAVGTRHILYVQAVLTHFIQYYLLYKMGQDCLDIQYIRSCSALQLASVVSLSLSCLIVFNFVFKLKEQLDNTLNAFHLAPTGNSTGWLYSLSIPSSLFEYLWVGRGSLGWSRVFGLVKGLWVGRGLVSFNILASRPFSDSESYFCQLIKKDGDREG